MEEIKTEKRKEMIYLLCRELGERIVWVEGIGVFVVSEFTPSQLHNHIDYMELTGRDITPYLDNFDSNITYISVLKNKIMQLREVRVRIHYSNPYYMFKY